MPDLYKDDQLKDDDTSLTIHKLGPEEKFAGTVLKSLKEKIEDAREELESVKEECEQIKEEAEAEKERILEEAREEADQIVQEAEQEAEEIISAKESEVEDAREEGYEDGYSDAIEDAKEETATLIEQGEQILNEARRERNAFVAALDEEFLSLVSTLAKQVVREHVELDREVVLRVVEDMVDEVREVREISLVLHPEDYDMIEEVVDDLQDQHPSLREITLVEDHKMERGGCRIHTEFGDLEGTITGQIEHLTEQLIEKDVVDRLSDETDNGTQVAEAENVEEQREDESEVDDGPSESNDNSTDGEEAEEEVPDDS